MTSRKTVSKTTRTIKSGPKKSASAARKGGRTTLQIQRLAHGEGLQLPAYQSDDAAGMDLQAACAENKTIRVLAGERVLVPTGLVFELERGFEAQVRPRSGLALKHGITVLNSPGTIDSDYRGEVGVILINLGTDVFEIQRGDRIAQVVIAPVTQARVKESGQVSETKRGRGGFGSTGKRQDTSERPKKSTKKHKKSKRSQTDSPASKTKKRKSK